jgi:hypothetical protein
MLLSSLVLSLDLKLRVCFFLTIDAATSVLQAANAPLTYDVIENFTMEDESCKAALEKNRYILIGNVGKPGSRYVENTPLYSHLDLYARGKLF